MQNWKDIMVLVVVVLIAVASLVWVAGVTEPAREANKKAKQQVALKFLFPKAHEFEERKLDNIVFFIPKSERGEILGVIVPTETNKGYGGTIKMLVGVDLEGRIVKLKVTEHHETPGLGSKATEDDSAFLKSFIGRSLEDTKFKVKKDGGDIDAVTSATITSRAICDAVERGLRRFEKYRRQLIGN